MGAIKEFMKHNYRHFNAAAMVDAAEGWNRLLEEGGKMLLTLGGAMSTAEMGISIAELIRRDKVHALSVTGANLEEDVFNLVARDHYRRVPNYRDLTPEDERALLDEHLNRVTDTCIPEEEAMRRIERPILALWQAATEKKERKFPYEYFYDLLRSGELGEHYQIDPKDSWMVAAMEKNLPIWSPGWEDSTIGNTAVGDVKSDKLPNYDCIKSGLEQMQFLVEWYEETAEQCPIGFFQVGGGISGDFPICVVPLIEQDIKRKTRLWAYFCQISDSTTSYGSYSGAVPNEKITWGKLGVDTPKFVIESDATIVFPLIANYILDN